MLGKAYIDIYIYNIHITVYTYKSQSALNFTPKTGLLCILYQKPNYDLRSFLHDMLVYIYHDIDENNIY